MYHFIEKMEYELLVFDYSRSIFQDLSVYDWSSCCGYESLLYKVTHGTPKNRKRKKREKKKRG